MLSLQRLEIMHESNPLTNSNLVYTYLFQIGLRLNGSGRWALAQPNIGRTQDVLHLLTPNLSLVYEDS